MQADEQALRERLGVPPNAQRVILFGESSHWDPNWLLTSEQYYRRRIPRIFSEVIEELEKEPRRIFGIESLFFLRLYWEREPQRREQLARLIAEGRLRLTGTGITTPDTNLPDSEAIIRDYLYGQQWLREQGLEAEPRIAYLTDDFGYSPGLPAILRALGIEKAGITRIDGMYFVATDYRPKSAFPLPGSSAELLQKEHKTADFIWRAPDGSEVLCHWNAHGYFQGDLIATLGVARWMGIDFGLPWRSGRHVARRINAFVAQLEPLRRTPYMFCPMGCDFNGPVPGLVELLDRYNRTLFCDTGVWAVSAGMDDYLNLVSAHRDRLPTLELDPNPYWMGFYATRPDVKIRCNRVTRKLKRAETLAISDPESQKKLKEAWNLLVLSNHHDFITGTSPDRIWKLEQKPWLEKAETIADRVLTDPAPRSFKPPVWRLAEGRLEVRTGHYRVLLQESVGGCISSFQDASGRELLRAPANDLVEYRDSGGLWRFGHEYRGGTFKQCQRSSRGPARIWADEVDGRLEVRVESKLGYLPVTRWLWFEKDSPIIRMRIGGSAPRRATIACRFPTVLSADGLDMDVPGGVVHRPAHKLFDPTYWPVRSFAHLRDGDSGLAVFFQGSGCVSCDQKGSVEWVVLRNAPREVAFGFLPILAHPASGTDPDRHQVDYAVCLTPTGDWRENRLYQVDNVLSSGLPIRVEGTDTKVLAIKPAESGRGLIVRIAYYGADPGQARIYSENAINTAFLCDATERDLKELEVQEGVVPVPLSSAIVSLRIET
jgi:alpha-mannosidase